jgi:hypothetical protein
LLQDSLPTGLFVGAEQVSFATGQCPIADNHGDFLKPRSLLAVDAEKLAQSACRET